eukprot:g8840.t1
MRRLLVAEVCLDCVVYTNLISACAYAGELQRAEACLEEMEAAEMQTNVGPERVMERMLGFDTPEKRPNALTFGLLIGALASRGDISGAERWYACMRSSSLDLRNLKDVDLVAHNAVISASARAHDAQRARLWFGRMKTANLTGDGMSLNSTLDPVARGVDVAVLRSEALEAEWLCDELDPAGLLANEITFSILMRPWALMGDLPNVDRLWQKMQKQGLQPKACNFWAAVRKPFIYQEKKGCKGLVLGQAPPGPRENLPRGWRPLAGPAEQRLGRLAGLSVQQLWQRFDRANLLAWYPGLKKRAKKHSVSRGYKLHSSDGDVFPMKQARQAAASMDLSKYRSVLLLGTSVALSHFWNDKENRRKALKVLKAEMKSMEKF